jgi:hypothetical protein
MFLSIFKMMLNAERCSVLPSSTVRSAEDPDPELCGLVGSGTFPGPQKLYILGRFILKAS